MKPTLCIEQEEGFLHARVSGENTAENIIEYLSAVRAACAAQGVHAVLIEENLQGPGLPVYDIYNIVFWGSRYAQPLALTVAFVNRNLEHAWENIRFVETAAVNRGLNLRAFRTVDAAREWLLDQLRARPGG